MPYRSKLAAQRRAAARLLRLLSVAALLLPLLLLTGGGLIAWHYRQIDAWDSTARLSDLVYESVSKLFDAQLMVLEETRALTEGQDDAALRANEGALHARMARMLRHLPHVRDVFVVGQDDRAIVDGVKFPAPFADRLDDRDYVQYFRGGGSGLFVSLPGRRKVDGLPFFALAIPREARDGAFAGVVATSVAPEFFQQYFEQAALAYGDAPYRVLALRRADGHLQVRSGSTPGEPVADDIVADLIGRSGDDAGRFEVTNPDTGRRWMVAWRRMPNVGMVVLSALDRAAVTRDWLASIEPHLFFGVPASLALFVITLLARRRTKQAAAAEAHAAAEMARRERAERAVRQSQKMEALGQLTGGVAHDFNNLLAVILGSAELAKRRPADKIERLLDNIVHAGQRASALTRQLLSFSRTQSVAPQVLDLRVELPRMIELLKPSLRGDIALSLEVAEDVWPVEVDPGEFEIAILNVAVNARDAMPAGGRFTIAAANGTLRNLDVPGEKGLTGDYVAVALSDTGPGMPPEVAARAFEPFFTTKDVGRGTGLGLSQVYGFARQAGGVATIGGAPGAGTRIVLFLPRSRKPPPPEAAVPLSVERAPEGRRVLLVEDNADVAAIATEMLRSLGWDVVHAERAQAALGLLDAEIDLLLSDVVMPEGMSGIDLARAVRERHPDLPILLMSGYTEAASKALAEFSLLRKPFAMEELTKAVRQAMRERPRTVVGGYTKRRLV